MPLRIKSIPRQNIVNEIVNTKYKIILWIRIESENKDSSLTLRKIPSITKILIDTISKISPSDCVEGVKKEFVSESAIEIIIAWIPLVMQMFL